jgi:ABC-type transport system involved in multi-copper enzyme maturation permease subunit
MIASLRADSLKARKRTANWILVGVLAAYLVFLVYVLRYFIFKHPPPGFRSEGVPPSVLIRIVFPENVVPTVLSVLGTIGAAIMLIMGALSAASEYGWSTVQTILVQKPGRVAVLSGKILVLAVASLLAALALFLIGVVASFVLAQVDGHPVSWAPASVFIRAIGAAWLILGVYAALGMALGVAFRSAAAAIGGGLTYVFVVEAVIARLLGDTGGIKEVIKFLPGTAAIDLSAVFTYSSAAIARGAGAGGVLISGTRSLVTLAVYLVVFLAIALLVFVRRDVTA